MLNVYHFTHLDLTRKGDRTVYVCKDNCISYKGSEVFHRSSEKSQLRKRRGYVGDKTNDNGNQSKRTIS